LNNESIIETGASIMPAKTFTIDLGQFDPPTHFTPIPGNYSIHLLRPGRSGGPLPISRIAGVDLSGTIEYGGTRSIFQKISHFKGSVLGTTQCDTEGLSFNYYFLKNKWLRRLYGTLENLVDHTRFCVTRTAPKDLRFIECRQIDEYCSVLGEPPVLNGQVPGVSGKYRFRMNVPTMKEALRYRMARPPVKQRTVPLVTLPPSPLTKFSCVYSVFLMDWADPSRICPFSRFARTDPFGILSIGRTRDLAARLRHMRDGVNNKTTKDEWSLLPYLLDVSTTLRRYIGPRSDILNRLHVTFIKTDPSRLVMGEIHAFNDYIGRYGELPPLNCQMPWIR
jgi:hypothetical protein